jgi:uncharacterized protein
LLHRWGRNPTTIDSNNLVDTLLVYVFLYRYHTQPMSEPPLKLVDPIKLARRNGELTGNVALNGLPRVAEMLSEKSGEAHYELCFAFDTIYRRAVAKGMVKAELIMECQRCLQPMRLAIQEQINWILVNDQQALKSVPDNYEGILIEAKGTINVIELLEEQILLGIPLIVKHSEMCIKIAGD